MSISIYQWCAGLGLFHGKFIDILVPHWAEVVEISIWLTLFYAFLQSLLFSIFLKHGDVEIKPGPKKKETRFFSCFHWNLNKILAHRKLSLLEAYNAIFRNIFRLFCFNRWHCSFPPNVSLLSQCVLCEITI